MRVSKEKLNGKKCWKYISDDWSNVALTDRQHKFTRTAGVCVKYVYVMTIKFRYNY